MKSNLHEGNISLSINVTILDQITSLNLFYKSTITFLCNLGIPLYILCMHIILRDGIVTKARRRLSPSATFVIRANAGEAFSSRLTT